MSEVDGARVAIEKWLSRLSDAEELASTLVLPSFEDKTSHGAVRKIWYDEGLRERYAAHQIVLDFVCEHDKRLKTLETGLRVRLRNRNAVQEIFSNSSCSSTTSSASSASSSSSSSSNSSSSTSRSSSSGSSSSSGNSSSDSSSCSSDGYSVLTKHGFHAYSDVHSTFDFFTSQEPAQSLDGDIVICDQLAFPANMGLVIRLCCNANCRALYFITTAPEVFNMKKVVSANLRQHVHMHKDRLHWSFITPDELQTVRGMGVASPPSYTLSPLLPPNHTIIGVETVGSAECVYTAPFMQTVLNSSSTSSGDAQERKVFIFGSEGGGVSHAVQQLSDHFVFVPSPGSLKSLNVASCVAVILFERVRLEYVRRQCQGHTASVCDGPSAVAAIVQ